MEVVNRVMNKQIKKIRFQRVCLAYALVFSSFGLFGCPKAPPPPPVEPPKPVVIEPEEPKPAPAPVKPVVKPKPKPKPIPPPPPPKEPEKPKRVPVIEFIESQYETIYFEYDESRLLPEARQILQSNAELLRNDLKRKPDIKLLIDGHCDERGTNEYNLALGERRAFRTRDYMISLGIPANILYTKSWGEEKPADYGHDEGAWARNRRAEFQIYKGD
jgi:peptidoglycan-associated lipoprotein